MKAQPGPSSISALLSVAALLASLTIFIAVTMAADSSVVLNVVGAAAVHDARTGKPLLAIRLDQLSAKVFAGFSAANVGNKVELRLNGKVLATPVLREPILGGALQIDLGDQSDMAGSLAEQMSKPGAKVEVVISQ
jgi:hypothetical protein